MSNQNSRDSYVWYAAYGSNMCAERFECYILGGQSRHGGKPLQGCTDKTLPPANKPFTIPYKLYFSRNSSNWDDGGVAFIDTHKETNASHFTFSRIWKITRRQFDEIKAQEGTWYDLTIGLGEVDGISVKTFTSGRKTAGTRSGDRYLKTIVEGLHETVKLSKEDICVYLLAKEGIKGYYTLETMMNLVKSSDTGGDTK